MKKIFLFSLLLSFLLPFGFTQTITKNLQKAMEQLLASKEMQHASISFCVANMKTGEIIFQKDGNRALSPASTQKILTAITAFELLGKDYTYSTNIAHTGKIEDKILHGDLIIQGSGDPSLGSWRYPQRGRMHFLKFILNTLLKHNIQSIKGNIVIDYTALETFPNPGGWPINDIGNYYGAGAWGINWHENLFDLSISRSDNIAQFKTSPQLYDITFIDELQTEKNKNIELYTYPYSKHIFVTGTYPENAQSLSVKGAIPCPPYQLLQEMTHYLSQNNIQLEGEGKLLPDNTQNFTITKDYTTKVLGQYRSPSLHEMQYWFLQKSINLYGEAFLKTITLTTNNKGKHNTGIKILKNFWTQRGLSPTTFHIMDGSGLSPQNAITAHAEVKALLYAKKQPYFNDFYKALPTYNNLKMKSGTLSRCKGFAGYSYAQNGEQYAFAFLINNYNGSANNIVSKMYAVLDYLK